MVIFAVFIFSADREARAEEFAVYVCYFLVMAVIRGVIEVRSEKHGDIDAEKS